MTLIFKGVFVNISTSIEFFCFGLIRSVVGVVSDCIGGSIAINHSQYNFSLRISRGIPEGHLLGIGVYTFYGRTACFFVKGSIFQNRKKAVGMVTESVACFPIIKLVSFFDLWVYIDQSIPRQIELVRLIPLIIGEIIVNAIILECNVKICTGIIQMDICHITIDCSGKINFNTIIISEHVEINGV